MSSLMVVKILVHFCLSSYEFSCGSHNLSSLVSITIWDHLWLWQFEFTCVYLDISSLVFATILVHLCLSSYEFNCGSHNWVHLCLKRYEFIWVVTISVHLCLSRYEYICACHYLRSIVSITILHHLGLLKIQASCVNQDNRSHTLFKISDHLYLSRYCSFVLVTISFHLCLSR
jgi:hypothetical protein